MRILPCSVIALALVCLPCASIAQERPINELSHGQRLRVMGGIFGEEWYEGTAVRLAMEEKVCWGLTGGEADPRRARIWMLTPTITVEVPLAGVATEVTWVRLPLEAVLRQSNCWLLEKRKVQTDARASATTRSRG